MNAEEVKLEAVRSLADFEAASAVESRSKLIDEHKSAFRWIVASLFALNGGGILSMFGRDSLAFESIFPAFWIFFGGIVSTFFTVIVAQMSDRLMIARMHQWGLYWSTVRVIGRRDSENESHIREGIDTAEKWGRRSRYLAMFAMVWFVLGVLGVVVLRQKSEISRIQSEMNIRESRFDWLEKKLDRLEAATPKR